MDRIQFLRQLASEGRAFLETTISGITPEQAKWNPPGKASPIVAQYAHVVMSQDLGLNGLLLGTTPLALGDWSGRTGTPGLPPAFGQSWEKWAGGAFDLPALRDYAQAVYTASDAYLEGLADADLDHEVDLTAAGFGKQTVGFVLTNGWINNVNQHCGEIACLKGLQDAGGYPL